MTKVFKLDKNNFINFCISNMSRTNTGKKKIRDLKINVIGVCVIIFFMSLFSKINDKTIIRYILLFICVFVLLLGKQLIYFKFKNMIKQLYNHSEYRELFENTAITLSDDGIQTETDDSTSFYNWSEIKGIHEVDTYIIINCYKPITIPVYCFDSDSDKEVFLKTICDKSDWIVSSRFPENIVFV